MSNNELSHLSISNLAKMLSHLIIEGIISLTALKVIDFTLVHEQVKTFLKIFFNYLFTKFAMEQVFNVFKRLALSKESGNQSVANTKKGIRVFFALELHNGKDSGNKTLERGIHLAKKLLETVDESVYNMDME